ncbi:hypothetical protein KAFR_0A05440 [Kazachstania africana CBS 2517]|uniref:Uncharacterized protein n=1 Tax=Kazachstania africana (strain ATCC 22294 / BCRC 22015 / CBS 2517 / CECT 1963 / NBRC 1671 / NRRL Y-8276) TaxID=1071382 RepID=H2ANM9_KAZAF|nr:hypothetical protein KAFR_0A05440 [Kazachstania africana CBS 2517]CCF55979.1 hypothetical protein KAFR_0A05440 [Kazachstania africana CBS 2517]
MLQNLRGIVHTSLRTALLLILGSILLQRLLNFLIACFLRISHARFSNISFGLIVGTTVRNVNISSTLFDLRIEKASFKIGWKPSIVFYGVDIVLKKGEKCDISPAEGKLSNSKEKYGLKDGIFSFTVHKRVLSFFKWVLTLSTLIRTSKITLPNGSSIDITLSSLSIARQSNGSIIIDLFLHDIANVNSNESLTHIGFSIVCDLAKEFNSQSQYTKITLKKWHSVLKIGDAHMHIPENILQESDVSIKSERTPFDHKILKGLVKSVEHPLRHLNILDIKIENLTLTNHKLTINLSSIQIYLEAVNALSNGTTFEMLPPDKSNWGTYELSLSANAITVMVNGISSFRIPLINIILTTNIIVYCTENISWNKVTMTLSVSIINPSIYSTVDEIIRIIVWLKNYRVDQPAHNSDSSLQEGSFGKFFTNLYQLPNFNFELSLSNFVSTFQLSESENLTFKLFSTQAYLGSKNHGILEHTKNLLTSEKKWPHPRNIPAIQPPYNNIKFAGANFSYLKMTGKNDIAPVTTPICGLESIDVLFDEAYESKIDIHCTARHLHATIEDIMVLKAITGAYDRFREAISSLESAKADGSEAKSFDSIKPSQWRLTLRLKDVSYSLILADILPTSHDPIETSGYNLAGIHRGVKVLLEESMLIIDSDTKSLEISDGKIYRIMDNAARQSTSDCVLKLAQITMTVEKSSEMLILIPSIHTKFDVNLIWLYFYLCSIWNFYRPKRQAKLNNKQIRREFDCFDTIKCKIDNFVIDVQLPENTPLVLRAEYVEYSYPEGQLSVSSLSGLVESIYVSEKTVYIVFLQMNEIRFDILELLEEKKVKVKASVIKFTTEYQFKVYMITENIITMYKSFKQLNLAFKNLSQFDRLHPSEMLPRKPPHINLMVENFLIDVEEDPFEQELGLILKVGVLEQKERLQKLKELEERQKRGKSDSQKFIPGIGSTKFFEDTKLEKLYQNFSTSWITRYRKAKLTFHGMPYHVKKYKEFDNEYLVFMREDTSTVAKLTINDLDLNFFPPSFSLQQYSDFLFEYGKGVPKDRRYTLLIPLGIDFKTGLWELCLRDYPIPVVSFPMTSTQGDVVFAEKMPNDLALYTTYVPFVPSTDNEEYRKQNSIYGSHIIRTMNSVKIYINIQSSVSATTPVNITWGKSLQPAFESLMLWFDFLTKPKLDPSKKLGFWDKIRNLIHGQWSYLFSDNSQLHLNIKGAHDPYKISNDGAGMTFCWTGNTKLIINGASNPEEFLKIESKKFELAIRDFLVPSKFDKVFMTLEGNVVWKLGILFEAGDIDKAGETPRYIPSRPHHDIRLVNPEFVAEPQEHDSFSGFRSNFIHMSFSVYSYEKGASNSLYLAPQAISHFLVWWNLFNTYTSGPIRQGPLFPELIQNNTKFGRALFTIKYQLHVEPLTIAHIYRHLTTQYLIEENSEQAFTGLKGRFGSLKMDLHQKKIKLMHTNEKLNRSKPVWKFRMSTGEIDCTDADVRIISTTFDNDRVKKLLANNTERSIPSSRNGSFLDIEDLKESDWYAYNDYLDLDEFKLINSIPLKFEAIPLLYSPKISYFRNLNDEGYPLLYPFGDEESHSCFIGNTHPEKLQKSLAKGRKHELERQRSIIENRLKGALKEPAITQKQKSRIYDLKKEQRELGQRHSIVCDFLNDLHVSGTMSKTSVSSASEQDGISVSGSSFQSKNQLAEKLHAVESFLSMRRTSNVRINSTYDNRFMIHNINLKIDKKIRDHLISYASSISERRTIKYALSYKSVRVLKDLLGTMIRNTTSRVDHFEYSEDGDYPSNKEFIERFGDIIKEVTDENFGAVDSYLFRLISPQIQLRSDLMPNTALLISARDIEVGIIDIIQTLNKSGKRIPFDIDKIVETRYGAITNDLQLFTLFKEDLVKSWTRFFSKNGYGMDKNSEYWPPWIPLEICLDGSILEKHVCLKRRSMFLLYTSPNPLYFNENDGISLSTDSKCRIGFPGMVITSNSAQYLSAYTVMEDLLSFENTIDDKVDKLTKVLLADEIRNNADKLDISIVTNLQNKIKELHSVQTFFKINNPNFFNDISQKLAFEIQTTVLRLTLLTAAIKKGYNTFGAKTTNNKKLNWHVGTDEVVWELFDKNDGPFITVGLGPSVFTRSESQDGINSNKISVSSFRMFNRQEYPIFREMLAPLDQHNDYDSHKPMVEISWIQGLPVGGISNMEELVITIQPILFKMDNVTSEEIMNYLFPKREDLVSHLLVGELSVGERVDEVEVESISSSNESYSDIRDLASWDLSAAHHRPVSSKRLKTKRATRSPSHNRDENINEMVRRSGTYFNVKRIHIKRTTMSVSYKGAHRVLTDVMDLPVKVPDLVYYDKVWSRDEFFSALKRDIVRVVVQNLGVIIGNKFLPHKKEDKSAVTRNMSLILEAETRGADIKPKSFLDSNSSFMSPLSRTTPKSIDDEEETTSTEDVSSGSLESYYPSS